MNLKQPNHQVTQDQDGAEDDEEEDEDSEIEQNSRVTKAFPDVPVIDFMKFKMTAVIDSYSSAMRKTIES